MRRHRQDNEGPPREEVIAMFGGAQIIRDLDGRVELRGGSPEERAQAREWMEMFLTQPELADRPKGR